MRGKRRSDMPPARRHRVAVSARFAVACLLVPVWPARAEMSDDEYRSRGTAISAPAERDRIAVELEAERLREAQEAERRAAADRARQEAEAAAWARQPPGERLARQRCTGCHTLAVTEGVRRGRLGWRLTVERMRWWHGAALGSGEAARVAGHLHRTLPAGAWRDRAEIALALLSCVLVLGLPWIWHRHRRRRGAPC